MTTIRTLGHSCVRLDRDGQVLVIDPGGFSDPDALDGATAVLVTHDHVDHLAPAPVVAALAADPDLAVWGPASVVDVLTDAGADPARLHTLTEGDAVDVVGFHVAALGGRHAVVHPDVPRIDNLAYLVDGTVLHPGDSFTPPPEGTHVEVLLLPAAGPWLKVAEAVDYLRLVAPEVAVPIHTAILNDNGNALVDRVIGGLSDGTYRRLAPGETLEVG